jgi:hypothetical protein
MLSSSSQTAGNAYMPQIVSARALPKAADPKGPQTFAAFIMAARKRFRAAADGTNRIRMEALDDLKFYEGEQWPPQIQSDRVLQNRPCLTINKLQTFAKQILDAEQQSRPAMQVNPVGSGADVETADIIQGILRHVEVISDADTVYSWGFRGAVIHGFGYWRILTEYISEDSMEQDIVLRRIQDPFCVYFDPSAKECDYSDAEFCFIVEDIPEETYRDMYPSSEVASLADFRAVGDGERDWFAGGNVRIAEYWWIEKKKKTLVQLVDGRILDDEQLEAHFADTGAEPLIMRTRNGQPMIRDVEVPVVKWVKMNGREILEPPQNHPSHPDTDGMADIVQPLEWPGKFIPIVPVIGEELIIDGKKKQWGMVRQAKDAQRQYNYARTGIVEQIALASKSPWLVEWSQIEGFEEWWRQANVRNFPFLPYRAKSAGNGAPLPAPIRNQWEPPVQALTQSLAQSDQDLMATTGQFAANIGNTDPGIRSGVAINALQRQGQQSNSNYMANLARSIRHSGRIILDLIPKVLDTPRIIRIVRPDGDHEMVPINGATLPPKQGAPQMPQQAGPGPAAIMPPGAGMMQPNPATNFAAGLQKVFDVTTGRYDITISIGASYQSKRQEFVQSVLALVQAAPQTFQFVMDLLVRNMDWPGAQDIADRLKKMLPPNLQDAGDQDQQIPPQAQATIQALLQEKAQLLMALQKASNPITLAQINNESKERIALLDAKVNIILGELKAKSAQADTMANLEYGRADSSLELWHKTQQLMMDQATQSAAPQQGVAAPPTPGASVSAPPSGPPGA